MIWFSTFDCLKRHAHEKGLSTMDMGGCFGPEILTADLFTIFFIIPPKVKIFGICK
jgi:hypothetical protein